MSKNIVILNGSPRRKGNTSALVREFTKGAESGGNKVTEFFLNDMDIRGMQRMLWRSQRQGAVPALKG